MLYYNHKRAIDAADNRLTMSAPMDPPPVDSRKWSRRTSSPPASTCSTDHCLSLSIPRRLLTLSNSKLESSLSQSRQHYINNGKSRTSKTNCIKRMTSTLSWPEPTKSSTKKVWSWKRSTYRSASAPEVKPRKRIPCSWTGLQVDRRSPWSQTFHLIIHRFHRFIRLQYHPIRRWILLASQEQETTTRMKRPVLATLLATGLYLIIKILASPITWLQKTWSYKKTFVRGIFTKSG